MDRLLSRIEALTNKLEQMASGTKVKEFRAIRKEMERVRESAHEVAKEQT